MKYLVMFVLVLFVGCGSDSAKESNLKSEDNSTFIYEGENTENKVQGLLFYEHSHLVTYPQIFSGQESLNLFLDDLNISRTKKILALENTNIDFKKENLLLFHLKSPSCGFSQIIISSSLDSVAIEPKRLYGKCNQVILHYDVACKVSKDIDFIKVDGRFEIDNF